MAGLSDATYGIVCVACAAIGYGSYYVPIKKHCIHDGLVYQWFQCCGILIAGVTFALCHNDWGIEGLVSTGFYVAPESLLSGFIFHLANLAGTFGVKLCGLGNYFLIHQLSNVGCAFLLGVVGPSFGVPATPPGHVPLAASGVLLVLLGMVPVAFMRSEAEAPAFPAARETAVATAGQARVAATRGASRLDALFQETPDVERQPSTLPSMSVHGLHGLIPAQGRAGQAGTGDNMELNNLSVNSITFGAVGLLPPMDEDSAVPFQEEAPGKRSRLMGIVVSLLAGAGMGLMYSPMLFWQKRLKASGHSVVGVDFFFGTCLGLFLTSTLWLLGGGAWKRYTRKRLEKSVLRPALFSGLVWGVACMCQLYAVLALPYSVAYCSCSGGSLVVSLIWGMVVFGEANSRHNRQCVGASITFVLLGVTFMGLSK